MAVFYYLIYFLDYRYISQKERSFSVDGETMRVVHYLPIFFFFFLAPHVISMLPECGTRLAFTHRMAVVD